MLADLIFSQSLQTNLRKTIDTTRDYADLWGPLSDLLKKLSAVVEM